MAARISQHGVEVLRTDDAEPDVRVTQAPLEVARVGAAPRVRTTQIAVEVLRGPVTGPAAHALVSQSTLEVARAEPLSDAVLSTATLEVARRHLPGPPVGLKSWMVFDDDHSLTVHMVAGAPPTSAADDLAVLNGENVALLGKEILQWRDAEDLGNNRYRLSRLLRGRLGTELFMNQHTAGEAFIILDPLSVRRVVQTIDDIGVQRFFRVVGAGLPAFGAPLIPVVNTGFSLMPWQPVHIQGARNESGDLMMTWYRRTRVNGEWRNGVDVALGESDERYEVDIIGGSGAAVRTLEVTTPTAIYTAAQQTTDFGAPLSRIAVVVYQLSSIVGRGHPGRAIL